jgi:hypothetical protein
VIRITVIGNFFPSVAWQTVDSKAFKIAHSPQLRGLTRLFAPANQFWWWYVVC